MTLEEAIQAAKNGDVGAMEALMDYYNSDSSIEAVMEWYHWAREAVQAGSLNAARQSLLSTFVMGLASKQQEKYDLAYSFFHDSSQAGIKLIGEEDIAWTITDHAFYNMALVRCIQSSDESEWEKAYQILRIASNTHLKTMLLEPYINHPCHRTQDDFLALRNKLLALKSSDFTRPDLEETSIEKKIYAFDALDIRMTATVYVRVADTLRENYHNLEAAKSLLEYGASVLPDNTYAGVLKSCADDYKRNLFGKLVYSET